MVTISAERRFPLLGADLDSTQAHFRKNAECRRIAILSMTLVGRRKDFGPLFATTEALHPSEAGAPSSPCPSVKDRGGEFPGSMACPETADSMRKPTADAEVLGPSNFAPFASNPGRVLFLLRSRGRQTVPTTAPRSPQWFPFIGQARMA